MVCILLKSSVARVFNQDVGNLSSGYLCSVGLESPSDWVFYIAGRKIGAYPSFLTELKYSI